MKEGGSVPLRPQRKEQEPEKSQQLVMWCAYKGMACEALPVMQMCLWEPQWQRKRSAVADLSSPGPGSVMGMWMCACNSPGRTSSTFES